MFNDDDENERTNERSKRNERKEDMHVITKTYE